MIKKGLRRPIYKPICKSQSGVNLPSRARKRLRVRYSYQDRCRTAEQLLHGMIRYGDTKGTAPRLASGLGFWLSVAPKEILRIQNLRRIAEARKKAEYLRYLRRMLGVEGL